MTKPMSDTGARRGEGLAIAIPPLPAEFLTRVRKHDEDALRQHPRRIVAEGGEPCRDVLRRARPGEELILASFSPFTLAGPYREYGPIFILARESDEDVRRDTLPLEGPGRYLRDQFVVRAYSAEEAIVDATMVTPESALSTIDAFLQSQDIAFLHLRFPTYGCFACRIDRG